MQRRLPSQRRPSSVERRIRTDVSVNTVLGGLCLSYSRSYVDIREVVAVNGQCAGLQAGAGWIVVCCRNKRNRC